jgi:hypothetical protein
MQNYVCEWWLVRVSILAELKFYIWKQLVNRFCPVFAGQDSYWKFHNAPNEGNCIRPKFDALAEQGFKSWAAVDGSGSTPELKPLA